MTNRRGHVTTTIDTLRARVAELEAAPIHEGADGLKIRPPLPWHNAVPARDASKSQKQPKGAAAHDPLWREHAVVDLKLAASYAVPIAELRLDGGTSLRVRLSQETITEYADAMRAGARFPPVVVFFDETMLWLADGFHRVAAATLCGLSTIPTDVRKGTQRDAVLFACGANVEHGLRRTNADKRRAVTLMLADEEWRKWSDVHIGKQCGVSHSLVHKIRKELGAPPPTVRACVRNGRRQTMDVGTRGMKGRRRPRVKATLGHLVHTLLCADCSMHDLLVLTAVLSFCSCAQEIRATAQWVCAPLPIDIAQRARLSEPDTIATLESLCARGFLRIDHEITVVISRILGVVDAVGCDPISPQRWNMLALLRNGPMNQRELATAVQLSPSAVSSHLKILEEMGLVRAVGGAPRRKGHSCKIELTPSGLAQEKP